MLKCLVMDPWTRPRNAQLVRNGEPLACLLPVFCLAHVIADLVKLGPFVVAHSGPATQEGIEIVAGFAALAQGSHASVGQARECSQKTTEAEKEVVEE